MTGLTLLFAMMAASPPPSVVPPSPPVESSVEALGPLAPLKGTMLAPASEKQAPVVLIVPGSGPTDRDGNSRLGLEASSYKYLAYALAVWGVASVRIDKRGLGGSAPAVKDGNAVTIGDYSDDVASWVASISKTTGARCVWVLGHSEGGLVALAAGARPVPGICGLVLVSAPGRPAGEILREQLRANPADAPLLPDATKAIDALEAGRHVDVSAMPPALQGLFASPVQDFLIDEYRLDPAKLIATYRGPVLIVQGERDLQVSPTDARLLAVADPRAKLALLPDVNHVLKTVTSDDRQANVATYSDPSLPVAAGVAEAIAAFVKVSR